MVRGLSGRPRYLSGNIVKAGDYEIVLYYGIANGQMSETRPAVIRIIMLASGLMRSEKALIRADVPLICEVYC